MTTNIVEPYVGPRPFQRIDEALFFGREKEASELLSLIIANPVLLLYARSGAGKTSLINARLFPLLEREEITALPVARVQGRVPQAGGSDEAPVENIYVFNALAGWQRDSDALMKMTLAEFLAKEQPSAASSEVSQPSPRVIFFDQFEELFTFYPGRWQDRLEFFRQVSDLLEGAPVLLRPSDLNEPAGLLKAFAGGHHILAQELWPRLSPEAQELSRKQNGQASTPDAIKLFVGDLNRIIQGESLYLDRAFAGTELRSETVEMLRRLRGTREIPKLNRMLLEDAFPSQIRRRLDGDPLLRIVFSMREDYIAELDPYASALPNKLRARYRLEPLRQRAALSAVQGPLEVTDLRFAPGVAEHLVENLLKIQIKTPDGITEIPGEFVEPVQLQVVCQSLWDNVRVKGEKEITETHLKEHGNVGKALRAFYEKTIQKVVQSKGVREGVLRNWFEEVLITTAGTRGMVFRGVRATGKLDNDVVDELESQHIIRAELRGGERWYELSHDRFIQPIRESNNDWRLARSGAVAKRNELEAKAKAWVSEREKGNSEAGLLDESAAIEAKRWLDSPEAAEVGFSEDLFAFVQSSRLAVSKAQRDRERAAFERENEQARAIAEAERQRADEKARSSARLRRLIMGLALMFLAAIGMSIYAFMQRSQAVTSAAQAKSEAERANQQSELAKKNEADANAARQESEKQKEAAVRNAEFAEMQRKRAEDEKLRAESETKRANEQAALARQQRSIAEKAKVESDKQRRNAEALNSQLTVAKAKLENALANAQSGLEEAKKQTKLARAAQADAVVANYMAEGSRFERNQDWKGALGNYEQALKVYQSPESSLNPVVINPISIHESIGRVLANDNRYEDSVKKYEEALRLIGNPSDKEGQSSKARILSALGADNQNLGRNEKAIDNYEKAFSISQAIDDAPGKFKALIGLGNVRMDQKKYDEAEKAYEDARDVAIKQNAQYNLAWVYKSIANLKTKKDDFLEAAKSYKQALTIFEQIDSISGQETALIGLIDVYRKMKNQPEVNTYTQKLQELQSKKKGN